MISYQTILQQLEKQLEEAKKAANEQQIREALTAVRALCDVVLVLPTEGLQSCDKEITVNSTIPTVESIVPKVNASKIKEDDGANGDSIFDF